MLCCGGLRRPSIRELGHQTGDVSTLYTTSSRIRSDHQPVKLQALGRPLLILLVSRCTWRADDAQEVSALGSQWSTRGVR